MWGSGLRFCTRLEVDREVPWTHRPSFSSLCQPHKRTRLCKTPSSLQLRYGFTLQSQSASVAPAHNAALLFASRALVRCLCWRSDLSSFTLLASEKPVTRPRHPLPFPVRLARLQNGCTNNSKLSPFRGQ